MAADFPVQQDELRRLKSLLFRPEQSQLDDIRSDVDSLKDRVGSKEGLETSTAEILVRAFRRAESTEHRALAEAVAPVVVAAIRSEIVNSRDMMVEALHPITGRMVAAAVSKAFTDLVNNLNAKIEALLSARSWRWRFQSIISGRPISEVALAETHRPSIRKIIVLERGSGILKSYWDADHDSGQKPDLISGLIAAHHRIFSQCIQSAVGRITFPRLRFGTHFSAYVGAQDRRCGSERTGQFRR